MGFNVASLWQVPEINPVNGKARSIPILNPINKYGRVFVSIPAITIFLCC
jgi:MFS transporter, NNP family, nitrate/nitrite transporter